jgi:hypothetical protein
MISAICLLDTRTKPKELSRSVVAFGVVVFVCCSLLYKGRAGARARQQRAALFARHSPRPPGQGTSSLFLSVCFRLHLFLISLILKQNQSNLPGAACCSRSLSSSRHSSRRPTSPVCCRRRNPLRPRRRQLKKINTRKLCGDGTFYTLSSLAQILLFMCDSIFAQ